jgi:sugar phosphate permease
MNMEIFATIIYLIIGAVLSAYWFHRDYKEEYHLLGEYAISEIACLFLVGMTVFWPIILIMEVIEKCFTKKSS